MSQDDAFRAELRKVYVELIPETQNQWTDALVHLKALPDNGEVITSMQRLGHNLKGTGTSYGFPIVTEIGRRVDTMMKDNLQRNESVSKGRLERLDALTALLFSVFDRIEMGSNEFPKQQQELDRLDGLDMPA